MNVRITAFSLTLAVYLAITAPVSGQALSNVSLPPLVPPPAHAIFAAAQIVDRPTADLRSRFHWGVFTSVVPKWSMPDSMGDVFSLNKDFSQMEGRDVRVGVVRGRQLGFEMGGSFVRKTITRLNATQRDTTNSGLFSSVEYSALTPVHMIGVDGHLMMPFLRIGERMQLGLLASGGVAWTPDTPLQMRVEGPPFYGDATMAVGTELSTPPATGGFVRSSSPSGGTVALPLVPGTRHAFGEGRLSDISPTNDFWILARGQLAADFLVAPPLKVRLTTGLNYPGLQALSVDAIYLFRTGRVSPDPGESERGSITSTAPIIDQPDVIAPRRSYWGVLGGGVPRWWTPDSWGPIIERDTNSFFEPDGLIFEGRDIRIGLTRGRPLGYELGVSFVRKSVTRFTFERMGHSAGGPTASSPGLGARVTLTSLKPLHAPGADFHAFVPIDRIGSRVQVGALLGMGGALIPDTAIQKRVTGPPFYATGPPVPSGYVMTPPPGGGFVVDDRGEWLPVAPGQTESVVSVNATEISPTGRLLVLARGQIATDVLVARPLKLRFSAGFNYPGAQLFGVEFIYLFGTGGN